MFFRENCEPLNQLRPETGEYLAKFKNHSELPNIIILLSFFGSLSHHFKVHRVEIWLYWVFLVIGEVTRKKCYPLSQLWPETGESLTHFKITHNYLIFIFYHHFLVHTVLLSDPSVY